LKNRLNAVTYATPNWVALIFRRISTEKQKRNRTRHLSRKEKEIPNAGGRADIQLLQAYL